MRVENENLAIERIFYLKELENDWRKSLPRPNDPSWIKTFPEIKESIPSIIEEWQQKADKLYYQIEKELSYLKTITTDEFSYWFFREWIKITLGQELIEAKNHIKRLSHIIIPKSSKQNPINDELIFAAKNVPLNEIADINLRKTGKNYMGLCPFHEDRHPSFYIYSDTNSFICFGCQSKGDTIDYVMQTKNLNFKEAVLWLSKGSK